MTDHLGPPPVDPLSDVTWARVERNVWAQLDSAPVAARVAPRLRWPWLAAPVLAIAVLAIVLLRGTSSGPAPSVDDEPSRIVAGASPSSVSFGDAHITLDAETAIVMSRDAGKPTALLERGGAWFAVAPRDARPPFVVLAGDAIVRVIGTRFRVTRNGEHAAVEVDHGLVEVRFRGSVARVGAGETWSSDQPAATRKAAIAAVAPLPPADPGPVLVTPAEPEHHHPPPQDLDRAQFEALAANEARHPDRALDGYLKLAAGSSVWAEVALYAAARLAADRHDHRATQLLLDYLRRYPNGRNVPDARQLVDHLKGSP